MSTIFDNFQGNVDLTVFKKDNPDPQTSTRRHYLSIVGLLQYVDIINGDATGELPEGYTEQTIKGMINDCIGDLQVRNLMGDNPEPPVPPEPIIYNPSFIVIHNESSWNEAYGDGETTPLAKYYKDNPTEDLWNDVEHRACNFNDKVYVGIIDDVDGEFQAGWGEQSQKITNISNPEESYYIPMFYDGFEGQTYELFLDAALSESAGKSITINSWHWSSACIHCWDGAINAPVAESDKPSRYPWVVIDTASPYDLSVNRCQIEMSINENIKYPWGVNFRTFNNGYAIASLPEEFGTDIVQRIDPANQEATDTFDVSTLIVKGMIEVIS